MGGLQKQQEVKFDPAIRPGRAQFSSCG
jgi:hypothetical protein